MSGADAAAGAPRQQPPGGAEAASLNLTSYIASLPAEVRPELYASPWTCQAVFRALPPLAQQYVLRLLYVPDPVPDGYVRNWAKGDTTSAGKHEAALRLLRQLSLLAGEGRGGTTAWSLTKIFRQRLRSALAGSASHQAPGQGQAAGVDPLVLSVLPGQEAIAEFAAKQWEGVLTFLLDPARQSPPSLPVGLRHEPLDVEGLVVAAGLIRGGGDRGLTGTGFRFLLMGTHAQLWALLREYIRSAEQASAAQLSSVLSFLMQLGFRRVGRPYPLEGLGPLEQRIAGHMAQLGLLYTFKAEGGTYYCPTALASTLCGGGGGGGAAALSPGGGLAGGGGGGGYVIVETNFRVYAYTSSRIQVRVLEEFCRLDCALPNLFVGTLTRDSVQRALAKGMAADDVIAFLAGHAHPQVAGRVPSVPETVQDQIRLWERETQRVAIAPAYWYSSFEDAALFERSRAFAQQRGLLLWDSADKQQMVVTAAGHVAVKEHIRQLKAQASLGAPL